MLLFPIVGDKDLQLVTPVAYALLNEKQKWEWSTIQEQAFQIAKGDILQGLSTLTL